MGLLHEPQPPTRIAAAVSGLSRHDAAFSECTGLTAPSGSKMEGNSAPNLELTTTQYVILAE